MSDVEWMIARNMHNGNFAYFHRTSNGGWQRAEMSNRKAIDLLIKERCQKALAATIEECAQIADGYSKAAAKAIRALKEQK